MLLHLMVPDQNQSDNPQFRLHSEDLSTISVFYVIPDPSVIVEFNVMGH